MQGTGRQRRENGETESSKGELMRERLHKGSAKIQRLNRGSEANSWDRERREQLR